MSGVLMGALMGAVFVFVLWCICEAVDVYRFERRMKRMYTGHGLWMSKINWPRQRGIRPLFWQQRRK